MSNVTHASKLAMAKQEFLSLISKLDPVVSNDFLDWIAQQRGGNYCCGHEAKDDMQVSSGTYQQCNHAKSELQSIIEDIRTRLPISGVCGSETMFTPETGQNSDCNPATTVVIDAFLYDDDEVDKLCDENKMTRNYCCDCGSKNTSPLTFISHSTSVSEIKFIFEILPTLISDFNKRTLLDIGSRLGAVLYGAYYFSLFEKIIGVEMNNELCSIQNGIIDKYRLGNKIQIINDDICNMSSLLQEADVIVLNNTFEFFLSKEKQISTWLNIKKHICKSGCIVITVPSIEESVSLGIDEQPIFDVNEWLVPLNIDLKQVQLSYFDDEELEDLTNKINFYKVK